MTRSFFLTFHLIHHSHYRGSMSLPFLTVCHLSSFITSVLICDQVPLVTPTSSPVLSSQHKQELVLFVGYPCLGKTSFYCHYFQTAGYVHINQDTLRTRGKCLRATSEALEQGKSCVIGKILLVFI